MWLARLVLKGRGRCSSSSRGFWARAPDVVACRCGIILKFMEKYGLRFFSPSEKKRKRGIHTGGDKSELKIEVGDFWDAFFAAI